MYDGSNLLKVTETLTKSMVSQWNSSGFFLSIRFGEEEVKSSLLLIGRNTEKFHRKNLCQCTTTFFEEQKTIKWNVWQMLDSYLCMQEDLEKDNGHTMVLVLRESCTLSKNSPQGIWDKAVRRSYGRRVTWMCCTQSQTAIGPRTSSREGQRAVEFGQSMGQCRVSTLEARPRPHRAASLSFTGRHP